MESKGQLCLLLQGPRGHDGQRPQHVRSGILHADGKHEGNRGLSDRPAGEKRQEPPVGAQALERQPGTGDHHPGAQQPRAPGAAGRIPARPRKTEAQELRILRRRRGGARGKHRTAVHLQRNDLERPQVRCPDVLVRGQPRSAHRTVPRRVRAGRKFRLQRDFLREHEVPPNLPHRARRRIQGDLRRPRGGAESPPPRVRPTKRRPSEGLPAQFDPRRARPEPVQACPGGDGRDIPRRVLIGAGLRQG
mmetsp:Transcript_14661/g.34070  ORF Transcript_14661/g.34070 Transcript_14661/m.34070 type:complete len:248 (+) Transcript_14661:827-1570(+)